MTDRLVVVDASAVLAFVLRERAAATIARVLPVAVIPAPNMTEVLYRSLERGYRGTAASLFDTLLGTGLEVEPLAPEDSIRAAEHMATSRRARTTEDRRTLSLGDGLCIAVAERLNLPVTGGDAHWQTISMTVTFHPLH